MGINTKLIKESCPCCCSLLSESDASILLESGFVNCTECETQLRLDRKSPYAKLIIPIYLIVIPILIMLFTSLFDINLPTLHWSLNIILTLLYFAFIIVGGIFLMEKLERTVITPISE